MWSHVQLNAQLGLGLLLLFSDHKVICIQVRDRCEGQFVIGNPPLPSPRVKFSYISFHGVVPCFFLIHPFMEV